MVGLRQFTQYLEIAMRNSKLTILWVSMDMGKGIIFEFTGGAMGLPMTLGCQRMIWSIHPICCNIGYRHTSEAVMSMLVFYYLGGFINCLLIANMLSILVQKSYKGLVFWELDSI